MSWSTLLHGASAAWALLLKCRHCRVAALPAVYQAGATWQLAGASPDLHCVSPCSSSSAVEACVGACSSLPKKAQCPRPPSRPASHVCLLNSAGCIYVQAASGSWAFILHACSQSFSGCTASRCVNAPAPPHDACMQLARSSQGSLLITVMASQCIWVVHPHICHSSSRHRPWAKVVVLVGLRDKAARASHTVAQGRS